MASDEESIGIVEESDVEEDENAVYLQENYNSLLEKSRKYARVAKVAVKKMKKAEWCAWNICNKILTYLHI